MTHRDLLALATIKGIEVRLEALRAFCAQIPGVIPQPIDFSLLDDDKFVFNSRSAPAIAEKQTVPARPVVYHSKTRDNLLIPAPLGSRKIGAAGS